MSRCRHCVQCCEKTNDFAGEGEKTLSIRSADSSSWGGLMSFVRSQVSRKELEQSRERSKRKITC